MSLTSAHEKSYIFMRLALTVKTAFGNSTLFAERKSECPWCHNSKWVYLTRSEPGSQWLPVEIQSDIGASHELHRCAEALDRNDNLRKHLGLKFKTWQERALEQYGEDSEEYEDAIEPE